MRTHFLTLGVAAALLASWTTALGFGSRHAPAVGSFAGGFTVVDINVMDGDVWEVNRPFRIEFSDDVDINTVNANTLAIRAARGAPAVGELFLEDARTVVFQPRCPIEDDLSDLGLRKGRRYGLRIVGTDQTSGMTVQSTSGEKLSTTVSRFFRTPSYDIFYDPVVGPPQPVVRPEGSQDLNATYVELGGDPARRIYFERAPDGSVALEGGAELPLNLLSNVEEQVALLLAINQPVAPFAQNISADRLLWQFRDQLGSFRELGIDVKLEQNCAGPGAFVRIEPHGVLPSGAMLRAVITTAFTDIVGESNAIQLTDFAPAPTEAAPDVLADSLEEEFLTGGSEPGSAEDPGFPSGDVAARWGDGLLTAGGFPGTGGTDGDFDWRIPSGQFVVLDTTFDCIVNDIQTKKQDVVDGVVDVRNVTIEKDAVLRIEGPNPLTLLASGNIEILGEIDASGVSNVGVVTLNNTNVPEPGSPGQAGGGDGGTGSPLTDASSPGGGPGAGAYNLPQRGGRGGETGWNELSMNKEVRRGAGGGGGRFGRNQLAEGGSPGQFDQRLIGLDAEPGFSNLTDQTPPPKGAISFQFPPRGGPVGPSPFVDELTDNDFFGRLFDETKGQMRTGELTRVWAGAGGGGGGDASFTDGQPFPMMPFDPTGDEKGAGGGGGGGAVHVLALGHITFGPEGRIRARGGQGGGGENTFFVDRVGGGSGGGSGGHVVLETASVIDFSAVTGDRAIFATGGQGGAGREDQGGSRLSTGGSVETLPHLDACPPGQMDCLGQIHGAGGDGGPGIIQLHTPGGLAGGDILLPAGQSVGDVCKPTPVFTSAVERLVPSFGRVSSATSKWLPIGLGGFDPQAMSAPFFEPHVFDFGDVDPLTGIVETSGGFVSKQPPLLGPETVVDPPGLPSIDPSGFALVMDASPLVGTPSEYLLRNTGLLDHFVLELSELGNPANSLRYDVSMAELDDGATPVTLTVAVASDGPSLERFDPVTGVEAALIPSFFRVSTDGRLDRLPDSAQVRIQMQATAANAAGMPDPTQATQLTADPDVLNMAPGNRDFRFLRFRICFDIAADGSPLTPTAPIPSVEFFRIPFRFE